MTYQYIGRGILPAVAGVALVWSEVQNLRFGLASRSWPSVKGEVIERGVDPGAAMIRADSSLRLVYRYSVRGAEYRSLRIDYVGRYGGDSTKVSPGLLRYAMGHTVAVFYDPHDPTRAVLEPGIASGNWWRLTLGMFLVLLGTALMV
jgi:hypothetical protein